MTSETETWTCPRCQETVARKGRGKHVRVHLKGGAPCEVQDCRLRAVALADVGSMLVCAHHQEVQRYGTR